LLEPYLRSDVSTVTFGEGGDVQLIESGPDHVVIELGRGRRTALELRFTQSHLRGNLLAAVAAADAVGVTPSGQIEFEPAAGRGGRTELADATVIDDCYNANPMSMRAALEDLAATAAREGHARTVAVLGDMLELGPREREFHVSIGEFASCIGVDLLITVGPLAAAMADGFDGEVYQVADAAEAAALTAELLLPGDVILVKASRGVGLELVCDALGAGATC
jgi:UDP-N-acetylmuramoyl-tripeptide--D-alanyl-D-alanine ligase